MKIKPLAINENILKISELLNEHQLNLGIKETFSSEEISFSVYDEKIYVGGIVAKKTGNRCHISLLAVSDNYRKKGLGQGLVKKVEAQAIKSDCLYVTVNTQEYQGLGFYQQLGFSVFGELENCPFVGTTKYFLKKRL